MVPSTKDTGKYEIYANELAKNIHFFQKDGSISFNANSKSKTCAALIVELEHID